MADSISFGEIHLDVGAGAQRQPSRRRPETPFRIVVLGDFSGRSMRPAAERRASKPILIDRDNFDDVMAMLDVRLRLGVEGESSEIQIRFRELEDFEPERVYERTPLFEGYRETRRALANRSTFEETAAGLGLIRRGGETGPSSPPPPPQPKSDSPSLSGASLLEGALEATEQRGGGPAKSASEQGRGRPDELSAFLSRVVAPHAVSDPHPKQDEILSRWDQAITEQMRALFHHPAFQMLEAAWRGLFLLTRRLETGTELKVYVMDCAQDELAADLARSSDLRSSRFAKALSDPSAEWAADPGWALLAGNYRFAPTVADAQALGRLGKLAAHLGAPLIAEAGPAVLGCESLVATPEPADWQQKPSGEDAQAWDALRRLPESRYLGLAAPRFLLRLPYGEDTVPTEGFPFEELSLKGPAGPPHEDFLWGNPAIACACLLGENFSRHGWDLRPGAVRQLDNIPMHLYKKGGESHQTPCGEAWLGERAAEAMLEDGVMPLLSVKDRDTVVLYDFRSITYDGGALGGPWD